MAELLFLIAIDCTGVSKNNNKGATGCLYILLEPLFSIFVKLYV